jgi:acylphosphatase
MEKTCVQIIISGKVQGVGYRYSAQQAADEYQLTGWVQNKINGDVEIIAEGEQHQLDQFISWTKQGPKFADVKQVVINKLTANNTFTQFRVR